MAKITQKRLKELLHYDTATGIFTWIVNRAKNKIKAGDVAGSVADNGYVRITVDRQEYCAHTLAFIYMTGEVPEIPDHKNTNKLDNSWENLREATWSQNQANKSKMKNNKSGLKGVIFEASRKKWRADIKDAPNKRQRMIGRYNCPAAASFAYQIEADKAFGEFARW